MLINRDNWMLVLDYYERRFVLLDFGQEIIVISDGMREVLVDLYNRKQFYSIDEWRKGRN